LDGCGLGKMLIPPYFLWGNALYQ